MFNAAVAKKRKGIRALKSKQPDRSLSRLPDTRRLNLLRQQEEDIQQLYNLQHQITMFRNEIVRLGSQAINIKTRLVKRYTEASNSTWKHRRWLPITFDHFSDDDVHFVRELHTRIEVLLRNEDLYQTSGFAVLTPQLVRLSRQSAESGYIAFAALLRFINPCTRGLYTTNLMSHGSQGGPGAPNRTPKYLKDFEDLIDAMVTTGLSALECKPMSDKQNWWSLFSRVEFDVNQFSRDYSTLPKRSVLSHISRLQQFLHDMKAFLAADAALPVLDNRLPAEIVEMVIKDLEVPDADALRASYIVEWPNVKCSLDAGACRKHNYNQSEQQEYYGAENVEWTCPEGSTVFYWSCSKRTFCHTHYDDNCQEALLCRIIDCKGHLSRAGWEMDLEEAQEYIGVDPVLGPLSEVLPLKIIREPLTKEELLWEKWRCKCNTWTCLYNGDVCRK